MLYMIKVGSVTNAQRAKNILNSNGYRAMIARVVNPSKEDGCGYAVRINCNDVNAAIRLLSQQRINVLGADAE